MPDSRTEIATPHASRYLQQLCKHWAHRFETQFTPSEGRVALPLGPTQLKADATTLTIDVSAKDESDLATLRDVVARHVDRFAFRETLRYDWS